MLSRAGQLVFNLLQFNRLSLILAKKAMECYLTNRQDLGRRPCSGFGSLGLGLFLWLGLCLCPVGGVEAQTELPSVPPEAGIGPISPAEVKLDSSLRTALTQLADPTVSPYIVFRELGLDVDARLRALVDIELVGNGVELRALVMALGGEVGVVQGPAAMLRSRVPIRQLTRLADEVVVVAIRAVSRAAASLPASPDFSDSGRPLPDQAVTVIRESAQEKENRSESQQKMDSGLVLAARRSSALAPGVDALARVEPSLTQDANRRVLIELSLRDVPNDLVGLIGRLGGDVENRVDRFRSMLVWMPLDAMERLASHPSVRRIKRALLPVTRRLGRSEGDVRHRADIIRRDFGYSGQGVTVGIISNGVDSLPARQQSGDLPSELIVLPGQHGHGDEGTAMMEIVNDLAPGARLIFATGFPSEAQMAQNILNLVDAGCRVIVDDVGHLLAPVFQDGPAAQAVEMATEQGVTYISAAGNAGNFDGGTAGVWEGDFNGVELTIEDETYLVHDFGLGVLFNELASDPVSVVTLQWADPVGESANDYDLMLLDESGSEIVAISNSVQNGEGDAIEFIDSRLEDHTWYRLVIVKASGEDRFVRLDTFGANIEFATPGQVFGHPAAENALAVGAVFQGNAQYGPGYFDGDEPVELFSSDGPRRMFFDADGKPYTPLDFSSDGGLVRQKPDFVAADGVSTNTPFYEQFFGTSAAAPHVAGIVALLRERGVTSPAHVRQILAATAVDVEGPGVDRKSGYGIVDAYRAMMSPLGVSDSLRKSYSPTIRVSAPELIGNDLPGIGEGQLSLFGVSEGSAMGGSVDLEDGSVLYRPPLGFRGVDSFQYTLVESGSTAIVANVAIIVGEPWGEMLTLAISKKGVDSVLLGVTGPAEAVVVVDQAERWGEEVRWVEEAELILNQNGAADAEIAGEGDAGFFRLRLR